MEFYKARQAAQVLRGETVRLMETRFVSTQFLWVEGHLEMLCKLRSIVGNDLDKVIILAVIGQRMLGGAMATTDEPDQLQRTAPTIDANRLTNIESIAAATGVPRESVRRKVGELVATGWVTRRENGGLHIEPEAVEKLAPTTEYTVDFLDRLVSQFVAMMVGDGRFRLEAADDSGHPG